MAVETGTATKLYGKNGDLKELLAPETAASQVLINDENGNASTVEKEIEALRKFDREITNEGAFMKASDTADNIKDGTSKVLMTPAERTKLSGVATGAEVNQAAFSKVKVGTTTLSATAKTDTLELAAGSGVTMSASGKKVTIAESYVDSCLVTSLDDVPANLRDGGIILLKNGVMTYALYVNNHGTPELVDFSQSAAGAVSIVRQTTTLAADIAAGEAVSVPSHVVGSQKLQVFVDGLLCEEGSANQYIDKTETTIVFNDAYSAGTTIAAVVVQNTVDPSEDTQALITAANAVSAAQTARQQDIDAAYKAIGGS